MHAPTAPQPRQPGRRRALVGAGALLASGLVLPAMATAAAPEPIATLNVCTYSHDGASRDTPVLFTPGAPTGTVGPGSTTDQVTMPSGRVDVPLPLGFASGVLPPGLLPLAPRTIPVTAWFAVEATNALPDHSRQHGAQWVPVATDLEIPVDASQPLAPTTVAGIPVAETAWTAAGGRIALRQATSGTLAATPAIPPPSGTTGSLVLRLDLRSWAGGYLTIDCRPGSGTGGSGPATTTLAKTVATAEPSVDGGRFPYAGYDHRDDPLPGVIPGGVDASLAFEPADDAPAGEPDASIGWLPAFGAPDAGVLPDPPEPGQPLRFPAGSRHVLRVTLSAAQRAAWLGADAPAAVTLGGWAEVAAEGLVPASRLIALPHRTWIPSATEPDGSTELEFALPVDGWTATDARVPRRLYPGRMRDGETTGFQEGNAVVLSATAAGTTRGLLLTPGRDATAPGGISTVRMYPGPRAYLSLPPTPAPKHQPPVTPEVPGDPDGPTNLGGGETPPPGHEAPRVVAGPGPVPTTSAARVRVVTTSARRRNGRVSVRLRNPDGRATIRARVQLRSATPLRLAGRPARRLDLTRPRTVVLKAGESRAFSLRLSADAVRALRTRRTVSATVRVTPLDRSRPATAHRITVRR